MDNVLFYELIYKTLKTVLRFPVAIASFVGSLFVIVYLAGHDITFEENFSVNILEKILPFLVIGFFLILAIDIYSEGQKINSIYLTVPTIIILLFYFLYLSVNTYGYKGNQVAQILLLLLFSAVLVIIAPFLRKRGRWNVFWHYNKKLVVRFIWAALLTLVLYIGLVLCLQLAVSFVNPQFDTYLFDIEEDNFWKVMSLVVTIGLLYLLSGIPKNFKLPDKTNK